MAVSTLHSRNSPKFVLLLLWYLVIHLGQLRITSVCFSSQSSIFLGGMARVLGGKGRGGQGGYRKKKRKKNTDTQWKRNADSLQTVHPEVTQ